MTPRKPVTEADLPDSLPECKRECVRIAAERDYYHQQADLVLEQLRLLRARLYGRASEQSASLLGILQLPLFEVELPAAPEKTDEQPPRIEVPAHKRQKPGRKPIPDHLPRVVITHDVKPEEKICGCGAHKSRIGEETSEQLDMEPAKMRVLKHVRPKYACPTCEGTADEAGPTIVIAPAPPQIIPKSIASSGLLAHVMTGKFADALPFYRQEGILARLGVDIGRGTMCGWAVKIAEACAPLLVALRQEVLGGSAVNVDETRLQVLDEPGRAATAESYLWLFRGGRPDAPAVEFVYSPTRAGQVAADYLAGFQGFVQTDDYAGYDFLDKIPGIVHLGCWAHARRKFADVVKAGGRGGIADEAILSIREFYKIEAQAGEANLSRDELRALRQGLVKPKLEAFNKWLLARAVEVPKSTLLGKAIWYALNQWSRLDKYINDGWLRPDNNLAENDIRPFVIGRKNWLFSGTPEGARASATIYSLVVTARANKLDPHWYLRCIFDRVPRARTADDYRALLPQYIDRALLVHA